MKLRIIKNLLEGQFDVNVKFKNTINAKPSNELRQDPFGKDKDGNVYYVQVDQKANIKVYQENQDEETWNVVANNREELVKLIDELKGHRPIRPLPKDLIDEDSSSNSRPEGSQPKEEEKLKIEEPASEQPQEYSIDNASHEFPLKQTIRLVKKPENVPESKEEEIDEPPVDEKEIEIQERAIQKKRRRK